MDTVTYPNSAVLDLSKSFVCIRIDHDKNPELVKQYGVGPLTDVRLLDAAGQEQAKLVGFSSASKLAARPGAREEASRGVRRLPAPEPAGERAMDLQPARGRRGSERRRQLEHGLRSPRPRGVQESGRRRAARGAREGGRLVAQVAERG